MTTPDPRTAASVERVRAELAGLADVPMPPDVADRIGRTLAGEPDAGPGHAGPRRRRGRPRRLVGLAVAAACVTAAFAVAGPPGTTEPRPVDRADALRATGAAAFGREGAGAFADPVRRRECLVAAGVPEPDAVLLGGVPHDVGGERGTLLVLGTAVTGRYRTVVVDEGCGRSGGRVLAEVVGGR